eukprot:2092161-Prymnesium_polylepis.1
MLPRSAPACPRPALAPLRSMPRGSCSDGRLERHKALPSAKPSWAACTVPSRACRSRSHDRSRPVRANERATELPGHG